MIDPDIFAEKQRQRHHFHWPANQYNDDYNHVGPVYEELVMKRIFRHGQNCFCNSYPYGQNWCCTNRIHWNNFSNVYMCKYTPN